MRSEKRKRPLTYQESFGVNRSYPEYVLEAAPGFEPGIKVLQTSALPLGYAAIKLCGCSLYKIRPTLSIPI
jgi:hypothetical protein